MLLINIKAETHKKLVRVTSQFADPGVMSLILDRLHTFVETDHKIFSTVVFLLPLIQEGMLSVTIENIYVHRVLNNHLVKLAQEKSVVR